MYAPNGSLLTSFTAYENALGIKNVRWSPSGQLLAIGSYDGKIRIMNHLTWKIISEFDHPTQMRTERAVRIMNSYDFQSAQSN